MPVPLTISNLKQLKQSGRRPVCGSRLRAVARMGSQGGRASGRDPRQSAMSRYRGRPRGCPAARLPGLVRHLDLDFDEPCIQVCNLRERGSRQIDDPALDERTPVIDGHAYRFAIIDVPDDDFRSEWQRSMGCGHCRIVQSLAAGRFPVLVSGGVIRSCSRLALATRIRHRCVFAGERCTACEQRHADPATGGTHAASHALGETGAGRSPAPGWTRASRSGINPICSLRDGMVQGQSSSVSTITQRRCTATADPVRAGRPTLLCFVRLRQQSYTACYPPLRRSTQGLLPS
jgi:hypothetical protein